MHVRTFEGESLDEALKQVKRELGPDAIILKTKTGKGLKGAFSRRKVEVTAAISEKNYVDKSKVDRVLDDEQKDQFYQAPADKISQHLHQKNEKPRPNTGYGPLGLNRNVQTAQSEQARPKAQMALDDFLREDRKDSEGQSAQQERQLEHSAAPASSSFLQGPRPKESEQYFEERFDWQKRKIQELEGIVNSLHDQLGQMSFEQGPSPWRDLRNQLTGLGLSQKIIQNILQKASFQLNDDDVKDSEALYDFALSNLEDHIQTKMPLFSKNEGSSITIFVSDGSCGQSTLALKLAGLKRKEATVFQFGTGSQENPSLASSVLEFQCKQVSDVPHLINGLRGAQSEGRHSFVDYQTPAQEKQDIKKVVDGIRRSFPEVEVMICLSAIHSEIYNRKILKKYAGLGDALGVSHLDLCLEYGALFNLGADYPRLPFTFFGTGKVVPEDIESASKERILAGLIDL